MQFVRRIGYIVAMNPRRRQQTLHALGLTPWVRRQTHAAPTVEALPAEVAAVADVPVSTRAKYTATATPPVAPASTTKPPAVSAAALPPVPQDWDGLRAAVAVCTRCKLCHTRTHTVFGTGPQTAPLMVIGEGPGADEDASGEAFVGRAGKLLDEMLKAIGCSRDDNTFITNVIKCRPPGNRDPEADEVAACRPYLEQQIRLLKPKLIVGLGRVAAQRLLDTKLPMSKLRGELHHYPLESADEPEAAAVPVLLTYHPAYLLRSPREKAKSWADLKQISRFLEMAG